MPKAAQQSSREQAEEVRARLCAHLVLDYEIPLDHIGDLLRAWPGIFASDLPEYHKLAHARLILPGAGPHTLDLHV